jgi:hypothetical protein
MQRTIRNLAFAVVALAITTQSASAEQFEKAAGGPFKPYFGLSGAVPRRKLALCPGD